MLLICIMWLVICLFVIRLILRFVVCSSVVVVMKLVLYRVVELLCGSLVLCV